MNVDMIIGHFNSVFIKFRFNLFVKSVISLPIFIGHCPSLDNIADTAVVV